MSESQTFWNIIYCILPMSPPLLCSLVIDAFTVGLVTSTLYPTVFRVRLEKSNMFDMLQLMSREVCSPHTCQFESLPLVHLQISVPTCHAKCPRLVITAVDWDKLTVIILLFPVRSSVTDY